MPEIVAITGGAGFIGSHLAEGFAREGYRVRVIDNLSSGSLANLASFRDRIEWQQVDIRNLTALTEAFRDVSIVLHHAGIASVPRSFADRGYTHEVNVSGTLNVLLAAVQSGVRKVINVSSSSIYGSNGADRQLETFMPAPLSPYGRCRTSVTLMGQDIGNTLWLLVPPEQAGTALPTVCNASRFTSSAAGSAQSKPGRLAYGTYCVPLYLSRCGLRPQQAGTAGLQ